ncbi:MAG: ASCH domain-containing protein [Methylobacillus glycogenes]|nr:ASCH domain-containing protein [Methylobacillus glycogenes]
MVKVLRLHLKGDYWQQIKAGVKPFEFRQRTEYWKKRIEGTRYTHVEYIHGYPKADDQAKRFTRPYFGYELQTIQHKHFGNKPVEVYAIHTKEPA